MWMLYSAQTTRAPSHILSNEAQHSSNVARNSLPCIRQSRRTLLAVYQLMGISPEIPPVTAHDRSIPTRFDALLKALK